MAPGHSITPAGQASAEAGALMAAETVTIT